MSKKKRKQEEKRRRILEQDRSRKMKNITSIEKEISRKGRSEKNKGERKMRKEANTEKGRDEEQR